MDELSVDKMRKANLISKEGCPTYSLNYDDNVVEITVQCKKIDDKLPIRNFIQKMYEKWC